MKWENDYVEREDDDLFRYDPNPMGWKQLFATHDKTTEAGLPIAQLVGAANPNDADVASKCLRLFIKYNKGDLAL